MLLMENSSWALLALLCLAALAFLSKITFRRHPKRKFPPGPKPWPVIGNLHLLGSHPHRSFHVLSQKYGDIMQLKYGKFPIVVASSPEMAKQFLRVHDKVFASRPALAAGKYTSFDYSDVVWAPYGPHWRQARKIYLSEVFNAKKLESFEYIRIEERRNVLSRLRSLSGKPVVLKDHLSRYSLSIICRMIFGDKYITNKSTLTLDDLHELLNEWFLLNGVFNFGDWIPWLSFIDLQGCVKKMKALYKKLDTFLSYVIDDHQTRRAIGKDSICGDFVDMLLQLAEDNNLEIKLTRDRIKGLIQDLLGGGSDTAAVTLEWAIHEILRNPRVIEKAKEELDRVIGKNRWVEEEDTLKLPYIDAIIMESMRLHPIGTLLVPHYAMEDCKVAGYDISKGTTILINTWSIGRNPNIWDAPEEFLPERFLDKDFDVTGGNFSLLPFGSGRRRCPGYNLGLKMVRPTLANLLHGFKWNLEDGMRPEDVSIEEFYGLTTQPKKPVTIIMEPTLPDHLY
ncbi:UNVERIFIED_CONTAM: Trimethyltridecatetraene synthase [Sesamum radiatum]|uniref:Cytochrome P450 n=1 Tax=Sesamum radiatum TaxID=300843 RepID=A0A7G1GDN1_SESRA|nr:cytochrome P450 [Sesamum radiatum]